MSSDHQSCHDTPKQAHLNPRTLPCCRGQLSPEQAVQCYTGQHWRVPASLLSQMAHYAKFAIAVYGLEPHSHKESRLTNALSAWLQKSKKQLTRPASQRSAPDAERMRTQNSSSSFCADTMPDCSAVLVIYTAYSHFACIAAIVACDLIGNVRISFSTAFQG